jgi:hypothetical protein
MNDEEILILWSDYAYTCQDRELILEFAHKIKAAERERCAKIAEDENCDQTEYRCRTTERVAKKIHHD